MMMSLGLMMCQKVKMIIFWTCMLLIWSCALLNQSPAIANPWANLLSFRHLSESRFCLLLHNEVNLQTYSMIKWKKSICHKYIWRKCLILVTGFKKFEYFHFSPAVKTAAKYANIDKVGRLDTGFQQDLVVQNFWLFHSIVMQHQ